jgi:tRNA modification GTPase
MARARHLDALRATRAELGEARHAAGLDLVAEHLRRAHHELGRITGEVSADDLLGHIFSSFCIGK